MRHKAIASVIIQNTICDDDAANFFSSIYSEIY